MRNLKALTEQCSRSGALRRGGHVVHLSSFEQSNGSGDNTTAATIAESRSSGSDEGRTAPGGGAFVSSATDGNTLEGQSPGLTKTMIHSTDVSGGASRGGKTGSGRGRRRAGDVAHHSSTSLPSSVDVSNITVIATSAPQQQRPSQQQHNSGSASAPRSTPSPDKGSTQRRVLFGKSYPNIQVTMKVATGSRVVTAAGGSSAAAIIGAGSGDGVNLGGSGNVKNPSLVSGAPAGTASATSSGKAGRSSQRTASMRVEGGGQGEPSPPYSKGYRGRDSSLPQQPPATPQGQDGIANVNSGSISSSCDTANRGDGAGKAVSVTDDSTSAEGAAAAKSTESPAMSLASLQRSESATKETKVVVELDAQHPEVTTRDSSLPPAMPELSFSSAIVQTQSILSGCAVVGDAESPVAPNNISSNSSILNSIKIGTGPSPTTATTTASSASPVLSIAPVSGGLDRPEPADIPSTTPALAAPVALSLTPSLASRAAAGDAAPVQGRPLSADVPPFLVWMNTIYSPTLTRI